MAGVEQEQAETSTAKIDKKIIRARRRLIFLWLLSFGGVLKMLISFFTYSNLVMDVSLKAEVLNARLIRPPGGQIPVYHRQSLAETTTGVGTGQPGSRWLYWCPIGRARGFVVSEMNSGASSSGAGNSNEARVRLLADLAGITVSDEDLSEVANRFASLMDELDRLKELDLSNVQPVVIFAEEP